MSNRLVAALAGAALLGISGVLLALIVAAARVVGEYFLNRRQRASVPPEALG